LEWRADPGARRDTNFDPPGDPADDHACYIEAAVRELVAWI
jgi:hypothetical protein